MTVFAKHRFKIMSQVQHPYKHSLDDFSYNNPAMGAEVATVGGALDWVFAVLYPQSKPAVATVADLPLVGNTLNDFRIVEDDGGVASAYRWEKRETEVAASWHKIYSMDWGADSILQQFFLKTQDVYVMRGGYRDIDKDGNFVTGMLAGQSIYGGLLANENLTLNANSGDGTGATTGFIQFADQVRPTVDSAFDLGTTALRFRKVWTDEVQSGTLNLQSGSIVDSGGTINFGATNLTTTGSITGGSLVLASGTFGTLTVSAGSIDDTSGNITFNSVDLSGTGSLDFTSLTLTRGAQTIVIDPDVAGNASLLCSRATLTFGSTNLLTTGQVGATSGAFGNLSLSANTLTVTNLNGNLVLSGNGSGVVNVVSALTTLGIAATGTISATVSTSGGNLKLLGNILSSTNANGDITITPNGTGKINVSAMVNPGANGTLDLGSTGLRFRTLYLASGLHDGSNAFTNAAVFALRNNIFRDVAGTIPAQTGDALFYDLTSGLWLANPPDSEITHGGLSGLGADDHIQYALLAGRAGGQTLIGGTVAGNNLTLQSTSHATRGKVLVNDTVAPTNDAVYSAGWTGTDLGGASNSFNNVYTRGEFINFRLENLSALPAPSVMNVGRLLFNTVDGLVYVDTGSSIDQVGGSASYVNDTSWNGSQTTQTFTVPSDARSTIWQLKDNSNNFQVIYADITSTGATTVVVTVSPALPAGTYRLIGVK